MNQKHKIEVFSAGCATCKETIEMVKKLAGPDHEVQVHDMQKHDVASRAKHGVRSLPAVVVLAAWDAMAKSAGQPLAVYLGGSLGPMPAYNSSGSIVVPAQSRMIAFGVLKGFEMLERSFPEFIWLILRRLAIFGLRRTFQNLS